MKQKLFFRNIFLFVLFLISQNTVCASGIFSAEKTREDSIGERALIFSLDFGSDRTYRGKSDSTSGYIAPDLFYQAPSGFFTSLVVYKTQKGIGNGEKDFTIGWDFKLFKHYDAEASYLHYFTTKSDNQVRSSLGSNLEFNIRREYKIISPKILIDYSFGANTNPDFNITLQLHHDFEFENVFKHDDDLLIRPYIGATVGTLNYLKLKRDTTNKKFALANDTQFKISALEFSLPIEYYIGRFVFTTSLTHTIPYNQQEYIGKIQITDSNIPVTYFTFSLGFFII